MAPSLSVISHAELYHVAGYMSHVRRAQDDFLAGSAKDSKNPGFKDECRRVVLDYD